MAQSERTKRDNAITRATTRLFWRANFEQNWSLVMGYGCRLIAWTANVVIVPLYVAYGLQAIITRHFELVPRYSLGVLILVLIFAIFISLGEWAIIKNALVGSDYLQKKVFNNYLSKDYEFYSDAFYGSLASQATQLRDSYNLWGKLVTLDIPRQSLIIVASLVVIGVKAPLLALITLICMALVLSVTIITSRWRLKWRREVSRASSEMSGVIGDALSHSTTVKSFVAEKYEADRLDKSLNRWKRAQYLGWISGIPAVISRNVFTAITIASLLFITGKMYQDGSISIAIVVLVQLYVVRMIVATQEVSEIIRDYESAMGSSYQAVKTMLVEPTILDPTEPKQLVGSTEDLDIKFERLAYSYDKSSKKQFALKDFSLTIRPGEKVGLVGYSGSGKTTLTKLLLRFVDATDGSIMLNSIDIRDIPQAKLREVIAYVPQEPLLFHRSIGENIAYGRVNAKNNEVLEAARTANVDEFVKELPNGNDTVVGERGIKLSGGQRQRVAIARAVLKGSPILVLDEATSALDSESEQYIQKALWNLMEDRTALVIAHRLSTIRRMDRIVVMDKGRIIQIGTHEELLSKKNSIYARLWAHQSGGYIIQDL